MERRPALDGLRAIAVLAVMAFHTSPAARGGFLGVDVFFVISGYLITTLLVAEWRRSQAIDLRRFYLRRALRLGPALLVMLVIAIPIMLTVEADSMGMPAWVAVGGALLYNANWANVVVDGGTGPITHTWSLAIEEQFYLVWPLLLLLVLRGRPSRSTAFGTGAQKRGDAADPRLRSLTRALAVVIAVGALTRWISWDLTQGSWIYYATTSHIDGLAAGAVLAIVLDRRSRNWRVQLQDPQPRRPDLDPGVPVWSQPAAVLGLAVIAALMVTMGIHQGSTYRFGLLLTVAAGVPVIHHVAIAYTSRLVRVLSVRPLVWIGTVSYGLYLFHFPIFQAVQGLQPGRYSHLVQHLLEIGLTVIITIASWFLVERPVLRLKARVAQPRERGVVRLPGVITIPSPPEAGWLAAVPSGAQAPVPEAAGVVSLTKVPAARRPVVSLQKQAPARTVSLDAVSESAVVT